MTRARESEEVTEVEEEKATNIVSDWDSPDLAVDLVDQIWDMVKSWLTDREPAASDFFYYCRNLCDNLEEADEVWVWMLNLIAHFVAEDESFLDSVHTAKDWRELALVNEDDWEVPPPLWLVRREEQMKREEEEELKNEKAKESLEFATNSPILDEEKEKDNGNAEESLDNTTASPLDRDWGKELPAPTPAVAAPSTPVWRPWEENSSVVNLSAVQKRKRRSPAAAARSRRRLQIWQEKKDMARLMPEPRTTPNRILKQIWSTNLLRRLEECANDRKGSKVQALGEGEMESSVLFCNHSQTIMQPQITPSSTNTKHPVWATPSSTIWPQPVSPVQQIVTTCPTCRIWNMSSTS